MGVIRDSGYDLRPLWIFGGLLLLLAGTFYAASHQYPSAHPPMEPQQLQTATPDFVPYPSGPPQSQTAAKPGQPDFGPYITELQQQIRRNWHPPDDRKDKTVILVFKINRQGEVMDITTKKSSGFTDADQAAHQAVRNAAPFKPLPEAYPRDDVSVEFTFDYNVYVGKSTGTNNR